MRLQHVWHSSVAVGLGLLLGAGTAVAQGGPPPPAAGFMQPTDRKELPKSVVLPVWEGGAIGSGTGVRFDFISDAPQGMGWNHPDELARVFLERKLPGFFARTMALDKTVPAGGKLTWIFTGPQGGFTLDLTSNSVHVAQRFYDSLALRGEKGTRQRFPEKMTEENTVSYTGAARSVTVEYDSKLTLRVKVNGLTVVEQTCVMDIMRDQLQFTGLRKEHAEVSGFVRDLPVTTTQVRVDAAKRFQTMLGWGGSPSIAAYEGLSVEGKKRYWEILQRYNLLIDREYPMGSALKPDMSNLDTLADSTPHYYGDNFPNSEVTSFSYNAMSLKIGGKVIYEMWALPTWATKDFTDSQGKVHKGAANVQEWARAMLTYTRMEKSRTGKAPDVLGIQNEIKQPKEITYAMVRTLRAELDKAGFKAVKIHMPDASFLPDGVEAAKTLRADADVWSKIDYAATHEYDYQGMMTDPDKYDVRLMEMHRESGDKPFLTTELCLNSPAYQIASYRVAFQMAQLYHKNLTILDSVGILYCWLILDAEQPNFPASRALLVGDRTHGDVPVASSFQLRALGAFSRRVKEGMVRVDALSSNPDLLVTAYVDAKGGKTLVALNRSMQPQVLDLTWAGAGKMEVERVSVYEENVVSPADGKVTVLPGEMVTLSTVGAPVAR